MGILLSIVPFARLGPVVASQTCTVAVGHTLALRVGGRGVEGGGRMRGQGSGERCHLVY